MPKVKVYNLKREDVGEIELSEKVFGAEVNEGLFYEVLKAQLASKRAGSAAVKNRASVAGSGRKIYKQKKTGNARHGARTAPIFVGGGVAHGPKVRSYAYRPPRKMRLGAMRSAFSMKVKEGRLTVVDSFDLPEIKTKELANVLKTLDVASGSLLIDASDNDKLRLSARNLASHQYLPPEGLNLYDLLRHDHVVLTKKAVEAIEARLAD